MSVAAAAPPAADMSAAASEYSPEDECRRAVCRGVSSDSSER
jgi:hypothetical protein